MRRISVPLCVLSCLSDDSIEFIHLLSGEATSRDSNGGIICNCLVGALPYAYYVASSPWRGF